MNTSLAVVIPAFRAERSIAAVIAAVPAFVAHIIVVDDASPDATGKFVQELADPRVVLLTHERNQGVGGAMVTGFRKALELGVEYIAKIDADGQMDPSHLGRFVEVAREHGCDYVKANRFGHIESLSTMPSLRFYGNIALTFLTKFVSGYWNVFDPQNGYLMISRAMLLRLSLEAIDRSYFFENSMLINLNIMRARIGEIYIPANYGDEVTSMRLPHIAWSFPLKLIDGYVYRVYQKYVFRSLSPYALFVACGAALITWSIVWGGIAWYESWSTRVVATTGTIMLALLPFLMGWSLLLEALVLDVHDAGPCLLFTLADEGKIDSARQRMKPGD